jgi:hypothetical protein
LLNLVGNLLEALAAVRELLHVRREM